MNFNYFDSGYISLILVTSCLFLIFSFWGFKTTTGICLCISLYKFIPQPFVFSLIVSLKIFPGFLIHSVEIRDLYQPVDVTFKDCTEAALNPKPGDIIEFDRLSYDVSVDNFYLSNLLRKYSHWGIYIGEDTIYHLVNDGKKQVKIKKDSFGSINSPGNGKCRINNLEKLAEKFGLNRLDDQEIFQRARDALLLNIDEQAQTQRYDELTNNCEHFVTSCVYGKPFSTQADTIYEFYGQHFIYNFLLVFVVYITIYQLWRFGGGEIAENFYNTNELFRSFILKVEESLDSYNHFKENIPFPYFDFDIFIGICIGLLISFWISK